MKVVKILLCLFLCVSLSYAESVSEKRKSINTDSQETLSMLYKAYPSSKNGIKQAYGYATFSNIGVNLIFLSAEGGSGVAVNNKTGKKTYMKMASGGVGIGLGVKDFRAIFVFEIKRLWIPLSIVAGKPMHKQTPLQNQIKKAVHLKEP